MGFRTSGEKVILNVITHSRILLTSKIYRDLIVYTGIRLFDCHFH